jgi:hypothetical protein
VIIGDGPRNLYVDIDGSNIPEAEYSTFGAKAVRTFLECISSYWGIAVTCDEVCIVSACRYSATKMHSKFLAHLRVHSVATTPKEMREFAKYYFRRLSKPEIVDLSVYKSVQQVRILGSTKKDDNRHSHMIYAKDQERMAPLDELQSSLIRYKPEIAIFIPATKLEEIPKIVPQPTAENTTVRYVLENTTGHHEGYSYRCCKGNRIYFKQVNPLKCDICNRQHDSDNALFMTLESDHVTKSCLRDPGCRRVRILELPQGKQTPVLNAAPTLPKKKPGDRLHDMIASPVVPQKLHTDIFADFALDEYSEESMRPYLQHTSAATLIIQAQKGVGKTEALVQIIQEHYVGKTIIALSHR